MTRPNNHSPRAPFFESLESRQHFDAASLPDLVPTLNFNSPAVLQPGAAIAPTLTIANNGAAIAKQTYVPIRLYVSSTPTLASNAVPFKTIQQPLTLGAGATTTVSLSSTLPSTIKSKKYFLIVRVNNRQALAESDTTNNIVASSRLANPVGTYTGKFTSSDGRPGTLSLSLSSATSPFSSSSSLFADFTSLSDGVRIRLTHLKSSISSAGLYQLKTNGSFRTPALGKVTYNLSINATLSGNTLTGTFQLHWQSNTASRNATSTFTLTRP